MWTLQVLTWYLIRDPDLKFYFSEETEGRAGRWYAHAGSLARNKRMPQASDMFCLMPDLMFGRKRIVSPKDYIEKIDFQDLIFAVVNWPNSELYGAFVCITELGTSLFEIAQSLFDLSVPSVWERWCSLTKRAKRNERSDKIKFWAVRSWAI